MYYNAIPINHFLAYSFPYEANPMMICPCMQNNYIHNKSPSNYVYLKRLKILKNLESQEGERENTKFARINNKIKRRQLKRRRLKSY